MSVYSWKVEIEQLVIVYFTCSLLNIKNLWYWLEFIQYSWFNLILGLIAFPLTISWFYTYNNWNFELQCIQNGGGKCRPIADAYKCGKTWSCTHLKVRSSSGQGGESRYHVDLSVFSSLAFCFISLSSCFLFSFLRLRSVSVYLCMAWTWPAAGVVSELASACKDIEIFCVKVVIKWQ